MRGAPARPGTAQAGPEGPWPAAALHNLPVSLIFVLYCYSGWNAAAYLAGEVREPGRTIPMSLLSGTAVVAVLYMGINVLFLYALPISQMSGVLQIGEKASAALFGPVIAVVAGGIGTILVVLGVAWRWPETRKIGALDRDVR